MQTERRQGTAPSQPTTLEGQLEERLRELDALNRLLLQESRKLERFITGYLARIGPYFDGRGPDCGHRLRSAGLPCHGLEHHARSQFRKLARRFHPDRHRGGTATMQAINAAYGERNLAALKRIEIEAEKSLSAAHERAARLHLRLQSLDTAVIRTRRMLEAVYLSPEYRLMQKADWSARRGIDFIAQLEAGLRATRAPAPCG